MTWKLVSWELDQDPQVISRRPPVSYQMGTAVSHLWAEQGEKPCPVLSGEPELCFETVGAVLGGTHTVMSLFCSSGLVMMYTWTVSKSSRDMKSSGTCMAKETIKYH